MNFYIKNILILIGLLSFGTSFGQGGLETGDVEIIKNFDATLEETDRLNINPKLPPLDDSKKVLNYDVPPKTVNIDYPAPKIKPIAIKRERLPKSYDGYAKAGYGIPNAILGKLFYEKIINKKLTLGLDLSHHSSSNNKKINNQLFSKSGGNINGNYRIGQGMAVKSQVGFVLDQYGLYGYDHEIEDDTSTLKQRFKTYSGNVKFYNDEPTAGDINYFAAVDFYRHNDNFATHETGTILSGGLVKYFSEKHPLALELSTDFTTLVDTATQNMNLFQLKPSFGYHHDIFNIKLGAILNAFKDDYRIFPDIEATVNVLGSKFSIFAGWKGDSYKNTFKRLTDTNPYLISRTTLKTSNFIDYYGGVKGNTTYFDYNFKGGYKNVNNFALFAINEDDTRRFDVLYDTMAIVHIGGGVDLHLMDDLDLGFNFTQNIYTPTEQEKAWYMPGLNVSISARYKTLKNKLFLKSDFIIQNGVPFINQDGLADNLNGLFDVNVGVEYYFTRNIGAFLDLNNLAANKRERWSQYPSYGLNLIGGISARF